MGGGFFCFFSKKISFFAYNFVISILFLPRQLKS